MEIHELLAELYGRIPGHVHAAVDGLDADTLAAAPTAGANPIGWIVWHLTRCRTTTSPSCSARSRSGSRATGRATSASRPTRTTRATGTAPTTWPRSGPTAPRCWSTTTRRWPGARTTCCANSRPGDLDRVVDERWDPPVTLGVRLVSIADDDIQHAGQAAYVRGLLAPR